MSSETTPDTRPHAFMDRLLGRHDWRITRAFWHFRGGGTATFEDECSCGQLRERYWAGEHREGRRLTEEEESALGPYPV